MNSEKLFLLQWISILRVDSSFNSVLLHDSFCADCPDQKPFTTKGFENSNDDDNNLIYKAPWS